jgi:hypothetical protein
VRVSEGIAPPFLTSPLDEGEWSALHPYRFTPREIVPDTHWIGGWVGGPQSQSGHHGEEKNLGPTGNRTPAVQPIARHYTD